MLWQKSPGFICCKPSAKKTVCRISAHIVSANLPIIITTRSFGNAYTKTFLSSRSHSKVFTTDEKESFPKASCFNSADQYGEFSSLQCVKNPKEERIDSLLSCLIANHHFSQHHDGHLADLMRDLMPSEVLSLSVLISHSIWNILSSSIEGYPRRSPLFCQIQISPCCLTLLWRSKRTVIFESFSLMSVVVIWIVFSILTMGLLSGLSLLVLFCTSPNPSIVDFKMGRWKSPPDGFMWVPACQPNHKVLKFTNWYSIIGQTYYAAHPKLAWKGVFLPAGRWSHLGLSTKLDTPRKSARKAY